MNDDSVYIAIWESCYKNCQSSLERINLSRIQMKELFSKITPEREEYALGSRYMHRGFYCPSPDVEYMITNMKRGKIAKRITSASCPTNRYLFNADNRLYLADTFYPNRTTKTEYIVYEQNIVLGVTFNERGISELSIEEFNRNRCSQYIWAEAHPKGIGYDFPSIHSETYLYGDDGRMETDYYILQAPEQIFTRPYRVFVTHYRNGFDVEENGKIIPQTRTVLEYVKKIIFSQV